MNYRGLLVNTRFTCTSIWALELHSAASLTSGPLGLRQLSSQVAVLEKGGWVLGFAFTVAVELQVVTSGTPLLHRDSFVITFATGSHLHWSRRGSHFHCESRRGPAGLVCIPGTAQFPDIVGEPRTWIGFLRPAHWLLLQQGQLLRALHFTDTATHWLPLHELLLLD